jgi:4-aminobutyrate aminotransferase-like enzyme
LQEQARRVGDKLIAGLCDLAQRHEIIGDVRGYGFFLGVELVADRASRTPATSEAARIKNALRARRILLGVEGPDDNVLKIRPPMSFDEAAAERLLSELDAALDGAPHARRAAAPTTRMNDQQYCAPSILPISGLKGAMLWA